MIRYYIINLYICNTECIWKRKNLQIVASRRNHLRNWNKQRTDGLTGSFDCMFMRSGSRRFWDRFDFDYLCNEKIFATFFKFRFVGQISFRPSCLRAHNSLVHCVPRFFGRTISRTNKIWFFLFRPKV